MSESPAEPRLNILTEPKVYLVGRQVTDESVIGQFLEDHEVGHWTSDTEVGGEKLVEVAGRVCYMSFAKPRPGGNHAYIHHILEVGHGSVLEHAVFSLLVTGVSRSLTHELVRHRAGFGYSQLSQRFVDESDCNFVEPQVIAEDAELHKLWVEAVTASQESYKKLSDGLAAKMADIEDKTLRRKRAREAARSVLPNATETKIFVTGNARALRHFVEMRGSEHADAEIRRLAVAVLKVLQDVSPNLFGDYVMTTHADGSVSVDTPFKKV